MAGFSCQVNCPWAALKSSNASSSVHTPAFNTGPVCRSVKGTPSGWAGLLTSKGLAGGQWIPAGLAVLGWCPREGQLHAATLPQLTGAAIQSPSPGKKPLSPSLEAEVWAPRARGGFSLGLSPGLSALDQLLPRCHRPVLGLHLRCLRVSTRTDHVGEMPLDHLHLRWLRPGGSCGRLAPNPDWLGSGAGGRWVQEGRAGP